VVGVTLAYQYHAAPLKLSYRGLGELAVALCYGPLIAIGTYLVQAPHISTATVLATLPLGLLISAFLWINEFPDFAADQSAGKKTLVVRLGRTRAAWCFPGLHLLAFTGIALLPALGLSRWVLLGESGLIAALPAIAGILRQPTESAAYIPIQKWSLLTFLLTAAGQGVGFVVSSGGT
jgi:1,4-dihydroxy-2-naphthoate octaprenyltransferase